MNKFAIAGLSFTAGAIAGFVVAQFVVIEKEDKPQKITIDDINKEEQNKIAVEKVDPAEAESPKEDDTTQLLSTGPAHIARPGQSGVNYSKVQQIVKEKGYSTPEEIQEVIDDPENEENYEERIEREEEELSAAMSEYRKKNKDKIVPIQKDEFETDFPEVDYDKKDLYYFTTDKVLTDEDGNPVDIEEYMGPKPGQFGWFDNAEERIYIRNNPKETDFVVWKQQCASEEWW